MIPEAIKKRGISQEVYKQFKLSYSNGILEIPIFDVSGKKLFSKYRHDRGENKYTYDKGGESQLYGSHLIKDRSIIILTEGELDTLVMRSHNYAAVSATSGAISNYKDEWITLLKDKTLYICYDNDTAGLKGMAKLKKVFPEATPLFIQDVNDISDYYIKHGEVDSLFNLTEGTLPEIESDVYEPRNDQPIDNRLEQARKIPITDFQTFNKDKKISCIFHTEKSASLSYNPKNNTFKCFGCGKFGDSVEFYMQLNNVDFKTALDKLVEPKLQHTLIVKENKLEPIQFLMTKGEKPKVRKIGENIKLVFEQHPDFQNKFRYDYFNGVFETSFLNDNWEELEDHIFRVVISKIQTIYPFFDNGMEKIIKDYAILAAMENRVSPPLQYIEALKWDGTERLKNWLHTTYHVLDNEYYSEVGIRWLKYLVKRLKYPGCKFDHVLIMNGAQGFGKSMILEKLCNLDSHNYFNETTQNPDNGKDFMIELRGNIIVEFAEGAITGYKDQKKVKSFITKQTDKYRPPYMKNSKDFPRQNVFAMTINDKKFLKDHTGERRYWPMEIPEKKDIYGDFKWIDENKDQLFAEAYTLIDEPYKQFSPDVQEYLDDLIEGYKEVDPVEDKITDWFDSLSIKRKEEGITVKDGKEQIDDEMREFKTKYLDKEIASIYLNVLKLQQIRKRNDEGMMNRLYVPSEVTKMVDGIENTTFEDIVKEF